MRWIVSGLLAALASASLSAQTAEVRTLRILDDRGQAIRASLEACFQVNTREDCNPVSDSAAILVPAGFVSVRVEGPDHGPVSAKRLDLKAQDGVAVLTAARKADLEIRAKPAEKLTVSLYRPDDPSFRTPAFRQELQGGRTIKIPAGEHLVSLTAPGLAPDLKLLKAPPASRQSLAFSVLPGWSLVLRTVAKKDGKVVSGAAVKLDGEEGFGPGLATPIRQTSGAGGLLLFSGLSLPLASATVEHPGFMTHQERGISSSPGSFAFREVELEKGAAIRVHATLDAKPAPGVRCQILRYEPMPLGPAPEPEVFLDAVTGKDGTCKGDRLPSGPYTLRLSPSRDRVFVDRTVNLTAGEETAVEVALQSIHVEGKVFKGTKPAPGYVITLNDPNEIKPNATRRDAQAEATTNEEGEFEARLWATGDYFLLLYAPQGTPVARRNLTIDGDEPHVEFHLQENGISGVVVDDQGKPVGEAAVTLRWNQSAMRRAMTDSQGGFAFDVPETGEGEITAMKAGYLASETVTVSVQEQSPTPPLRLKLKRAGLLSGRIVTAAGPAAGASVQSYRIDPKGNPLPLAFVQAKADGTFEVAGSDQGATRIYVSGAGCPLSRFDVQPSPEDVVLRCQDGPSSLLLEFQNAGGEPLRGRSVWLVRDGSVIPDSALVAHLASFGLPAATDTNGHLYLVALAPGSYDVYRADRTGPEMLALGMKDGFITSVNLGPLNTTELKVTLDE